MRKRLPLITYGNVVSTLALFIALGGVSYAAATLPRNSVGTAQLKNNAVTSAKVRDKSIAGRDLKSNTITGKKIKLSSLGTVPKAAKASSADSWSGAVAPVLKRVSPSADNASEPAARAAATEVPLAKNGSLEVYAKCYTTGGSLVGRIIARTGQNGTVLSSTAGPSYFGSPYLDTTTTEDARYLLLSSVGSDSVSFGGPPYAGTALMIGPDGSGLNLRYGIFLKNGSIAFGNGPYGVGKACLFELTGENLTLG